MNETKQQELINKYPNLLGNLEYIACSDGWYTLLDELCSKLIKVSPETVAVQIKEKFGGLRFYVSSCNDEGYQLIHDAERKSLRICEFCGRPATKVCDGLLNKAVWFDIREPGDIWHNIMTCDKLICDTCALSHDNGRDYCPICKTKPERIL